MIEQGQHGRTEANAAEQRLIRPNGGVSSQTGLVQQNRGRRNRTEADAVEQSCAQPNGVPTLEE